MIKLRTAALFIASFIFSVSGVYSQKESVILYNRQPVKVELSKKGTIESFIGTMPGYMEGYDLSDKDEIKVEPTDVKNPILPPASQNAQYKVVSTDREELKYKPNFATLDREVISKLNVIAAKLKADPNATILLTAHTRDKNKNKLTTNRLDSAIAYLGIKGILSYRIQTDIQESESLLDIIAVNYFN